MPILTVIAAASVGLLVAVTVLPMWSTDIWWIRAMDIPRLQIVIAAAGILVIALLAAPPLRAWLVLAALACLAYQAWRIAPYTPLTAKEVVLAPAAEGDLTFLAANVLRDNRSHDALLALIDREDPDTLFLMEIDAAWSAAMAPVLARYSTVLDHPQDNHYGLIFATRLPVRRAEVVNLTPEDVPTVLAELEDGAGRPFNFVGLHPKPPVPGEDTAERDAQIAYSARFARAKDAPTVVMGDFNVAAWSDQAQAFKRYGEYLDPRIGRGPLPSFDATSWILRFPIDQLYFTPGVVLADFRRGPDIGSDHFPMLARLRLDTAEAARLNRPRPALGAAEIGRIEQMVDDHRARLPGGS